MANSGDKSTHLLVAAFDFGTTYSGYAFSFRDQHLNVKTNTGWNAGSQRLVSLKTPTCVLVDPDKKFHSFGYEAENKYADLAEDDEHQDWLLFKQFKMVLHNNQDLSRDTTVDDISGTPMPALDIFCISLQFLRDHFLEAIDRQTNTVEEEDVKYVLTVPAIWNDSAKQFMREAAVKAGFDTKRLQLAFEPEAASVWCQSENDDAKAALSGFETKFAVVDLGGGTADISVHEKERQGTLKELHISGGPWGGVCVDENFLKWLENIFNVETIQKLKTEQMADYFDLLRDFEMKKPYIKHDSDANITFRVPASLMKIYEEESGENLTEKISKMGLSNQVRITADKIRVEASIVRGWFEQPIKLLIKHLQDIFHEKKILKDVSTVLLVGGFGESELVQKEMEARLKTKRIITPHGAVVAVVKGAVVYGHIPQIISSRVILVTYGFKAHVPFNKNKHPKDKMVKINGEERIYVFKAINSAGDEMKVGESKIKKNMRPNKSDRTVVEIYNSDKPTVDYISDEGCSKLGKFEVYHPEGTTLSDKKFDLIFIFGDTELTVKARIQKNGREYFTSINCLKQIDGNKTFKIDLDVDVDSSRKM